MQFREPCTRNTMCNLYLCVTSSNASRISVWMVVTLS